MTPNNHHREMTDWPSIGGNPARDREEGRDNSMITTRKPVMSLSVDKGCDRA